MKTCNYINHWLGTTLCGVALLFCSRHLQSYIYPSQRWQVIDYLSYLAIILTSLGITVWKMNGQDEEVSVKSLPLAGIRLMLRYFLAFIFMYYGFAKLLGNQFYPLLYRSDKVVSQLKGMDKAWIFFGHSESYKYFLGCAQVFASVLLFFRRSTFTGLLLLLTISCNIVYLNFAFNIPVKFDSCLYLFVNLYLLAFYFRQVQHFILTQPEPKLNVKYRLATSFLFGLIILLIMSVSFSLQLKARFNDTWKTKLYGIYDIGSVLKNGRIDSTQNFKTFYFDIATLMNIRKTDNKFEWADYKISSGDSIYFETDKIFRGNYLQKHDKSLILKGIIGKDSVIINLLKRKENKKE
jgi:hypothetical protein